MDLVERHAVTAIVCACRHHRKFAPREDLRDDLREFSDAVVFSALADIEDPTIYPVDRSLERATDRLADIFNMDDRPPRTAVARHRDFLARPRKGAEVIQHDVESHPWRRPVRSRVAQERDAEVWPRHRRKIAFDKHLALRVYGLRVCGREFVEELTRAQAIDTARRGVDEPTDAGSPCRARQIQRTLMVDS